MTIPEPPRQHRLVACTGRFLHQLTRTKTYIETVIPALGNGKDSEENLQFCFQTIVLMLHSFMEEHFGMLIGLATIYCPGDVRRYLASRHVDKADQIEETPAVQLARHARREVAFRQKARKLKGIFEIAFSVGPFADAEAEANCLDLIQVRNIITHQGGLIEGDDLPQLHSPDVVVKTTTIGSITYPQLHIQPAFLLQVIASLVRSVASIDESLRQDPRYSI